jgi:hypothetical protein
MPQRRRERDGSTAFRDVAAQFVRYQARIQSTKSASSTVLVHTRLVKEERDIRAILSLTVDPIVSSP